MVARINSMIASVFRLSEVPVILPPGAFRSCTSFAPTGSETAEKTTGVSEWPSTVDCTICAAGVASGIITSTLSSRSFAAI